MNSSKKKRFGLVILIVLLLVVAYGASERLRKLGNEISGDYLKEMVARESNGLYELQFKKLDLNIFTQRIDIKDLELVALPENRDDSIQARNIYEALVGRVTITLESVIRIYTKNELVVDGIEVVNPLVYMTNVNPDRKPIKFGQETGKLYEIISEYLDLLRINYLKVKGAEVNHSPSMFNLRSINFAIENFTISEKKNRQKIFYSEAINLGVNKQSILLPDSIHQLSFDGFELSTNDSTLIFNNLKITARDTVNENYVFNKLSQNVYAIQVPNLELKGINYAKAYEENHLLVNQVNIPKPDLKIKSVLKVNESNKSGAQNSIGASLLALFDFIQVQDFKIQEGSLDLTLKGENQQRFISDNISIDLSKIALDSTQRDIQNILQYFEDARIEINDYDYLLPDDLHEIKFKKLHFNTIDSTLAVSALQIRPSRQLNDKQLTQFTLELPDLFASGVDPRAIYYDHLIKLNTLKLDDAQLTVMSGRKTSDTTSKKIISPSLLYEKLNPAIKSISIRDFSLNNSDFQFDEILKVNNIDVISNALAIDSAFTSWHSIGDSTAFTTESIQLRSQDFQAEAQRLVSSSNLRKLETRQFNIKFNESTDQLSVEYLNLGGLQLDSIITKKVLQLDSISLVKPKVALQLNSKMESNGKSNWKLPQTPVSLRVREGEFLYEKEDMFSLGIDYLNLDMTYEYDLKLDKIDLQGLTYEDRVLNHRAELTNVESLRGDDNLLLQNLRINPLQQNDSVRLSVSMDSIQFSNFNKLSLLKDKQLRADTLFMNINQIQFAGQVPDFIISKSSADSSRFGVAIGRTILKIAESDIRFMKKDSLSNHLTTKETELMLKGLSFPNPEKQLLFSDEFSITNEQFDYLTPKNDSLSINGFIYASTSKELIVEEVSFKSHTDNFKFNSTDLNLIDADINDYFTNNRIKFKTLSAETNTLAFKIKEGRKAEMSNKIKMPIGAIEMEELFLKDINFKLFHQKRGRYYYVREADLVLNSLALDSIIEPYKLHQNIESLVFSGKNYKEEFGEHYSVSAKDYTFRYPESDFEAHNITLNSSFEPFEYSDYLTYQNDLFSLNIPTLQLNSINVDHALNHQQLILERINVLGADFTVFRDLSVPHNRDKVVPMPQKSLATLDFGFSVDTVFVNSDINIHISPKENKDVGKMSINIDSGYIYQMNTHHFSASEPMRLNASGRLNNSASFRTSVTFYENSANSEFQFKGSIDEIDLKSLNKMLIPLGAIQVRSGTGERVDFNFKGNDDYAEGMMKFRYKNLKIDFLDRKTYRAKGFGNNLKTVFANSFVVSNKNPRWFKLQEGNIFFERIKSRSIFNLWAKSLLSGAVSSIGIKRSKEEAKAYYKENQKTLDE